MKIIPVEHASYEKLEQFLEQNAHLDRKILSINGYVVEIGEAIEGSFVLDEVNPGALWLKQLYITQSKADKLPVLLEMILHLAKEKQAKTVHVHSHQPVVDILLQALQFHPEKKELLISEKPLRKGSWWSYEVS